MVQWVGARLAAGSVYEGLYACFRNRWERACEVFCEFLLCKTRENPLGAVALANPIEDDLLPYITIQFRGGAGSRRPAAERRSDKTHD